jgi:hypothetical protein
MSLLQAANKMSLLPRRGLAVLAAAAWLAGCAVAPARLDGVTSTTVGAGWAGNSINTVAFRQNALVSDARFQYIAYYDQDGHVMLGKRPLGGAAWDVVRTDLAGDVRDAHNAISIMLDGAGYLHLAWNHHDVGMHYARGVAPGSLVLRRMPMVGRDEGSVSYPQFFRLPDGGLLFFYRDGSSGRGNLVLNRYDPATASWRRVADNLISGEGRRNAYWQACVDGQGTVHVSWVWRASPDVASNHDMAYARSRDGGRTWEDSAGRPYTLPITAASADYAARIPQGSALINQTSMAADGAGHPYIASYWRAAGAGVPQYRILYHDGAAWRRLDLDFRTQPFALGGVGTKAIPIARPQLLVSAQGATASGVLVFRDRERGDRVSVVRIADFGAGRWSVFDLEDASTGAWEPTFDTELWRRTGALDLLVQRVTQVDGEGLAAAPPAPVRVLHWRPQPGARPTTP